jgi:uncharacterized membrane protein
VVRLNWQSHSQQFITALILSSVISEALFGYTALHNHSLAFDYLTWNLALAWLPLIFATRLTVVLRRKLWSSWEALTLSVLWLGFLPNSFYMISDYIHLQNVSQSAIIYDALILTSFIYTGVTIGFSSLFLIHLHLKRRLPASQAALWIGLTLFISSIAIYFGRDLRWNSWDVLTNPGGLLFDASDRLMHVTSYPQMVIDIVAFFVLLCTMYNLLWRGAHLFYIKRTSSGHAS